MDLLTKSIFPRTSEIVTVKKLMKQGFEAAPVLDILQKSTLSTSPNVNPISPD